MFHLKEYNIYIMCWFFSKLNVSLSVYMYIHTYTYNYPRHLTIDPPRLVKHSPSLLINLTSQMFNILSNVALNGSVEISYHFYWSCI